MATTIGPCGKLVAGWILCFTSSAIVGGLLTKSDKKGLAVIFWIGTGLKLGTAVGVFWWKQERHQEKSNNSM
jgi:hypothetical protein